MKKIYLLILVGLILITTSCSESKKIIKVGASSIPHAMILEQAKDYVENKGYKLEIIVFDDYVLPNLALENKELDANYFQHEPYLNDFNKNNGTHIYSIFKVHFEPMGIYQGEKKNGKIVVPSDKSNYDRAVNLLKANNYPVDNLILAEAKTIPLLLKDCEFAVINGNYAMNSNVTDKCIVTENKDSDIAEEMGNVIAVTEENKKTEILIEALKQDNIKQYIEDQFPNVVIYIGNDYNSSSN